MDKENCSSVYVVNLEERSKKYIEYHMFETFSPIFEEKVQVFGLWHEVGGELRYESILEEEESGKQLSYLFPVFDPDCNDYDGYGE